MSTLRADSHPPNPADGPRSAAWWLCLLACLAPVFALTVHGWANGMLYASSVGAVVLLAIGRAPAASLDAHERRRLRWFVVAMLAPLLAAMFSAALRGDGDFNQFDAPSRFMLAIPLALLVARTRFDVATALRWVLPASLLAALVHHMVFGQPARWPDFRMAVAFADPLVLGYTSLAAGLMALVSITPADLRGRRALLAAWCLFGAALGFYLSVRSGSRTGWFAAPLLIALWVFLHWTRRPAVRALAVVTVIVVTATAAFVLLPRGEMAWEELEAYSFSGVAPDSSIGLRITFLRIAAELFSQHLVAGVGDTARLWPAQAGHFAYASPEAVRAALQSAFHNQFVSNAVRLGALGLVATALLLLVPLAAALRGLRLPAEEGGRLALVATAFFLVMFTSSLSTEIVDLKYMAGYFAVMTGVLAGGLMRAAPKSPPPAS